MVTVFFWLQWTQSRSYTVMHVRISPVICNSEKVLAFEYLRPTTFQLTDNVIRWYSDAKSSYGLTKVVTAERDDSTQKVDCVHVKDWSLEGGVTVLIPSFLVLLVNKRVLLSTKSLAKASPL